MLYPLTTYLAELLPEGARDSSRTELFFEDLEKLPPGARGTGRAAPRRAAPRRAARARASLCGPAAGRQRLSLRGIGWGKAGAWLGTARGGAWLGVGLGGSCSAGGGVV